jgi:hypothetical protein
MRGFSKAPAVVTEARAASTDWLVARSKGLNCRTKASKLAVSNSGTSAARLGLVICAALAVLGWAEAKAGMAPVQTSTEVAKHAMVFKECLCSGSGTRLERIMKGSWV